MPEKKKMGRPTSNPKTHRFELRLSEKENQMLEECTQILGCSKTDAILHGLEKILSIAK